MTDRLIPTDQADVKVWEAATDNDMTGITEIGKIEASHVDGSTPFYMIGASNLSSTEHRGLYASTTKFELKDFTSAPMDNGPCIATSGAEIGRIQEDYFQLRNIGLNAAPTGAGGGILNGLATDQIWDGVTMYNDGTAGSCIRFSNNGCIFRNCLFVLDGLGVDYGIRFDSASNAFIMENCTLVCTPTATGTQYGINLTSSSAGSGIEITNTICSEFGSSDFRQAGGTPFGTGTYVDNGSSDTTAPTGYAFQGEAASTTFTDPDGDAGAGTPVLDFSLLTGSAAIGAGTDLSGDFTTDITGTTRATWDVGAYYYSAGGASGPLAIMIRRAGRRLRRM